jgi:hypothetical protein
MDSRRTTPGGMPAGDPREAHPETRLPAGGAREIVTSFTEYREAQRAVDFLSDRKFDVRSLAIVAEGLSFVEQVTGRLNWSRALVNGASTGALIGALIGFIFGIFNFFAPLTSALALAFYGLLFGAFIGAVIGLIGYSMSGGQRDFTSVSGMQAERYNVTADPAVAGDAREALRDLP